ncbi:hypothetical protein [Microbulbifer litoralis]|uniref:hypothetical protein n=1 Tax=Microbulbifer litoralis TaxID=2933965 RepID=UPI0020277121|nr:hypothetical protein [Microbulbifer sp. GX H0434]
MEFKRGCRRAIEPKNLGVFFLTVFLLGCGSERKGKMMEVNYDEGKSPYDFESRIKNNFYVESRRENFIKSLMNDAKKRNKGENYIYKDEPTADIAGYFLTGGGDNPHKVYFNYFVISYEKDSDGKKIKTVGFYFDEKNELIWIRCSNGIDLECPEFEYPNYLGMVWTYGN